MSLSIDDRREEFKELEATVRTAFEALIKETQTPEQSGLLRSKTRYNTEYEYGPFTVELYEETGPEVQSVHMETDVGAVIFTENFIPEEPLFGNGLEVLKHVPQGFETVWDTELSTENPHLDSLSIRTNRFIELCDDPTFSLADVIEAFAAQNTETIQKLFDLDSVDDSPEVARLVNRRGGELRVHFQTEQLALVSFISVMQFESTENGAFVIGQDDTPTGFFVHQVDDRNIVQDTETTETAIRRAMGFTLDLDFDSLESPIQLQKTTRVQGDLKLTFVQQLSSYEEATTRTQRAKYARHKLERIYGPQPTDTLLSAIRLYEDGESMYAAVYDSYVNEAEDVFEGEFPHPSETGRATINRRIGETLTRLVRDSWPQSNTPVVTTNQTDDHTSPTWLNMTVDNHLLRFENAWYYPLSEPDSEPVMVVVPRETTLSVTHDEHPEKRLTLPAGLYEVGLLSRGASPDEFTSPTW